MGKKDVVVESSSKSLGERVREANAAVKQAEDLFDEVIVRRSLLAKEVFETEGAGPFDIDGQLYTIRKRLEKDDDGNLIKGGKELYYFVVVGNKTIKKL
jgi:hypothetical protein